MNWINNSVKKKEHPHQCLFYSPKQTHNDRLPAINFCIIRLCTFETAVRCTGCTALLHGDILKGVIFCSPKDYQGCYWGRPFKRGGLWTRKQYVGCIQSVNCDVFNCAWDGTKKRGKNNRFQALKPEQGQINHMKYPHTKQPAVH